MPVGKRYLNRRLSKQNNRGFSRSNSTGLLSSTTGSFGSLSLGRSQTRNGRGVWWSRWQRFRNRLAFPRANAGARVSTGGRSCGSWTIASTCSRLKASIKNSWKAIRQDLKAADSLRSGTLPARKFRSVMARHDVALSEDDFYIVMQTFSRNAGGNRNVHYDSFLRMILR